MPIHRFLGVHGSAIDPGPMSISALVNVGRLSPLPLRAHLSLRTEEEKTRETCLHSPTPFIGQPRLLWTCPSEFLEGSTSERGTHKN